MVTNGFQDQTCLKDALGKYKIIPGFSLRTNMIWRKKSNFERFCAVALNEDEIAIIGGQYMHHHHHEVEGTDVEEYEILVSNTMSTYNLNTGRWIPQQCM